MAEQLLREPPLLLSLIGDVTVGESYFFRLRGHFAPLIAAARSALARASARFSVWSAGCATGEEPYSIALALRDALPNSDLNRVTILGSDVDRSAIAAAEAAVYGSWSFRGVEAAQIERGFRRLPEERYQLSPELRQLVTFRHYPLREHLSLLISESLDAIFYRNVSVYLSDEANESMYEGFARVLRPGGLLFIAPTDIRPKVATLRATKSADCTIFERLAATPSCAACDSVIPTAVESSRARHVNAATNSPDSWRRADPLADAARTGELTGAVANSPDPWRRVDRLADAGELSGALELLARQADTHRHSPEFHKRCGRLHLAHGDAAAAVADFRRVLYMLPDDNPTRYWYALALRNVGQYDAARHQLALILDARVSGDEGLLASAAGLLRALPAGDGLPPASRSTNASRRDPLSGVLQPSDGRFDADCRGRVF